MKRAFVVAILILFAATIAFAQGTKELTGTVDSISPIDPSRGDTDGSIVVIGASGNAKAFLINTSTAVTDEASKTIGSTDVDDGDTVKVAYVDSDNGATALSISRVVDKSKQQ